MAVRRVVTGHTPAGEAIVVSDGEVAAIPVGDRGSGTTLLWGRDAPGQFPTTGANRRWRLAPAPAGARWP
jgi:hypothetical protein